jgi:hypothetical protein
MNKVAGSLDSRVSVTLGVRHRQYGECALAPQGLLPSLFYCARHSTPKHAEHTSPSHLFLSNFTGTRSLLRRAWPWHPCTVRMYMVATPESIRLGETLSCALKACACVMSQVHGSWHPHARPPYENGRAAPCRCARRRQRSGLACSPWWR